MDNNPISLTKILDSINSTLNIANKAMPLYQEAKPIFKTISSTYKSIKNNKSELSNLFKLMLANNTLNKENNITNTTIIPKEPTLISKTSYNNTNNPKFFI